MPPQVPFRLWGVQLPQQVGALPAEHGRKRGGAGGADGGHDLEEEVVAVAASGDGWFGVTTDP